MVRWKFFTAVGTADSNARAFADEGCPVCDHPFGHLTHACIRSIGATAQAAPAVVNLPISLPETVVAQPRRRPRAGAAELAVRNR